MTNPAPLPDKVNIMIVDDMPINVSMLEKILVNPEYRIFTAYSGEEALDILETRDMAVILLDVKMPGMDGFETARRVRENEKTRDIPIIFITAELKDAEHIAKGFSLKAVDYLLKPFNSSKLQSRVALLAELYRKKIQVEKQAGLLRQSEKELRELIQKRNRELELLSREVAQRKKAEELLEEKNRQLETTNQELNDFAHIVSHDLREPLRGIHNFSNILLDNSRQGLSEKSVQMLTSLSRLSLRLDEQINAILEFSRIGRFELNTQKTDLNAMVKDVLELLKYTLEESGTEVRIPRSLPVIYCDKGRIREVFANLITNAVKFNDKNNKWVEIGYSEKNGDTVLYVRDNGIGISSGHQDKIFQMFKRLHKRDEFGGGTGAGLAIVQKIIKRHGGKVWMDSIPGEGTTFYFQV